MDVVLLAITAYHLQLRLHVLQDHAVVAAKALLQLQTAAGLLLLSGAHITHIHIHTGPQTPHRRSAYLPGPAQVSDDRLELGRKLRLRLTKCKKILALSFLYYFGNNLKQ